MSVTTDELYATAEGLAIDEIASILYYQHLKAGKGDESAQWVYNLTMKELLPRDMMVKNMVDNEVSLETQQRWTRLHPHHLLRKAKMVCK